MRTVLVVLLGFFLGPTLAWGIGILLELHWEVTLNCMVIAAPACALVGGLVAYRKGTRKVA